MQEPSKRSGKVIIAGAGPGDPGLLTLKAARSLRQADVILSDRLVSPAILSEWAAPEAEVIWVGKQCRRGASTPQRTINELMIHHASEGKTVVRLKGGDVSLFSNVLDELQALSEHGIAYELVPGVTAGLGAAAYAGIPLTARGYATAVRFLTCYKSDVVTEAYWKELAQTDDTLVFYMSSETLELVAENLLAHGISADKKLAVVEQATTPLQKVYTAELNRYREQLPAGFASPTLLIIGRVVGLHEAFRWRGNSSRSGEYFRPVEGIPEAPSSKKEKANLFIS